MKNIYANKTIVPSYFFIVDPVLYSNGKYVPREYPKTDGPCGPEGSILTMELNLKKKQIIYYINNICHGPAYENMG